MKKTKFVKANIKNIKEAFTRLMDGEVFYSRAGHSKIYFDASCTEPFRFDTDPMRSPQSYPTWLTKKEVEWYEDIPEKGVLCWCYDENSKDRYISVVSTYSKGRPYPFVEEDGSHWKHATPIKKGELDDYYL